MNRQFLKDTQYIEQLQNNELTRNWLKLGIVSLGLAGLYSIILVILRTPQLSSFFPNPKIFKSALIIHVNLSVLVWLLSITASIWSYNLKNTFLNSIYYKLAFIGTILIAISPLAGQQNPVMNNYIPMLENIIFILGLALFGVSTLLFAINTIYLFNWQNRKILINFTILSTAIMFILTWVCFVCSYRQLQNVIAVIPIDIEFYYELLFWSGGHLLQFVYTQILILIWIILFENWQGKKPQFQKFYLFLFLLNFIFSTLIVAGHFCYDIIDGEFKEYYTTHMKYFGGFAPVSVLLVMIYEISRVMAHRCKRRGNLKSNKLDNIYGYFFLDCRVDSSNLLAMTAKNLSTQQCLRGNYIEKHGNNIKNSTIAKTTLICSSILFLFGGLIALKIVGINVVIPAHYHGSIVGISIACMGFTYLLSNANRQSKFSLTICILTFGQIVHILGLALAGGYGVLRKDPSIEMALSAKLLMGMMGGGGLIAIVGGLMFVFICGKNMFLRKQI